MPGQYEASKQSTVLVRVYKAYYRQVQGAPDDVSTTGKSEMQGIVKK